MSASDPLRYDSSYGACFRHTSGTDYIIDTDTEFVTIKQLQFKHDSNAPIIMYTDNAEVNRCICVGEQAGSYTGVITINGASGVVNSLVVTTTAGDYAQISLGWDGSGDGYAVANTCLHPSDVSNGDQNLAEYSGTNYSKGNAGFGMNAFEDGSWGAGSDYNGTDDTTAPGGNSLTSLTYADQFENTTAANMNARLKAGSDLIDAAIQYAETNDEDILGNPRSTSTPSIGCYEPVITAITASGSPTAQSSTGDGEAQISSNIIGSPSAEPSEGVGTVTVDIAVSGSPTAQSSPGDGTITVTQDANLSGSPSAEPSEAVGTVTVDINLTGSPTAQASTGDGIAAISSDISGLPTAQAPTGDGTVTVIQNVKLIGSPSGSTGAAAGILETLIAIAGNPTAQASTGDGTVTVTGGVNLSGSPTAQASTGDGVVDIFININGNVVSGLSLGSGELLVDPELMPDIDPERVTVTSQTPISTMSTQTPVMTVQSDAVKTTFTSQTPVRSVTSQTGVVSLE